jgi:peptidoglycan/LPS O-acetylase OafA/YrhL
MPEPSSSPPSSGLSPVLSHAAYRDRSYFAGLDGLRALAILMVILHHVTRESAGALAVLTENGRYGVSLFFLVSGYLICTLFLREEARTGRIALAHFYARRAARLFPLYYVMLAIQALAVFGTHFYPAASVALFDDKLPAYLFYYSNLLPTATEGPFFFAWSLAVEEQFYLWFGFAIVFLPRRPLLILLAVALGVKFAGYSLFGPLDAQGQLLRVIFSYREPLLIGVLLGYALHHRVTYEKIAAPLGRPGAFAGLALLTIGFLATHPMQSATHWDGLLLLAALTLLVAAVVTRAELPFLGQRHVAHYGKVSYGIYLMHMFVIAALERFLGEASPNLVFALAALASGLLATLSFAFFEQPIMNFFRRRRAHTVSDRDAARPILPGLARATPPP